MQVCKVCHVLYKTFVLCIRKCILEKYIFKNSFNLFFQLFYIGTTARTK